MIEGINHIAIAVEDIERMIALFESLFGLAVKHREYIEAYEVDTATFAVGSTEIELVEGKTPNSGIRKYVEKNGPGIHHIAFAVSNIQEAIAKLRSSSVRLIDDTPRCGKEQSRVAFIHPAETNGILFELVEPAKPGTPRSEDE
jgi:methylmalonyl-CoA/ethylmalonyl-CoA epimerase